MATARAGWAQFDSTAYTKTGPGQVGINDAAKKTFLKLANRIVTA